MAAFQRAEKLRAEGVGILAASSDPLEKAKETTQEFALTYPVGYGLDPRATAAKIGAFFDPKRNIIHSTGFVLRPDRTIATAVYSSGPIGRLVWQDVLGLVQFYKSQK